MNTLQDPAAAETAQTTNVPAVDLPRLVRLANGDWIKPAMVAAIRKMEIRYCSITKTLHEPRYAVDLVGGMIVVIECADAAEVSKQVDELAAAINGTSLPNSFYS